MLGRVVEELCEEYKIDGAISALSAAGIQGKQLVDTVAKSCNLTKKAVRDHIAKMDMK